MTMTSDGRRRCMLWLGRPAARECEVLAAAGWELRVIEDPRGVRFGLRGGDQVAALIDLRHADAGWLAAVRALLSEHDDLPCFVLGGDAAVLALDGAATPLREPLDLEQAMRLHRLADARHAAPGNANDLVGSSPAMLAVRANLHRFGPVDLPVLITGETGTGKELAAHALHALSQRGTRPFVAINCGALPATLVQAELFGHERGAFTGANTRRIGLFETADGGTVFLDEIGDLPADAQTNLLRVLQEGTIERIGSHQPIAVDVRVLAATHVDLEQAVASGRFREDLYYRLDVLRLQMPPLRARGEDIVLLARHFLEQFRQRHPVRARGFEAEACQRLRSHAWPGNVRELLNRVRRAAVVCDAERIPASALELDAGDVLDTMHDALGRARLQAERDAVLAGLRETGFNISACARRLKVSRVTLYRLCRKHGLELDALRL